MQFHSLCNHDQAGLGDGKSLGVGLSVVRDLEPGPWVAGGLLVIGLYFLCVGLTERRETT